MKYIKGGTKAVIYGPDNMKAEGIRTYTDFNFTATEELIDSYVKDWNLSPISQITRYLGSRYCVRLNFNMNYELQKFNKQIVVDENIYCMWVTIDSFVDK